MANPGYLTIKTLEDCKFEELPPIKERVEKFLELLKEKDPFGKNFTMKELQSSNLKEFFYLFLLLFNTSHDSYEDFKNTFKQKTQIEEYKYKDFKSSEISTVFGWVRASRVLDCDATLFRGMHDRNPKAFLEFYYKVIDPLFFLGKKERDALEKIKKQASGFIITP